jgi:crossover junction endodeoxyribonuclease RuvC
MIPPFLYPYFCIMIILGVDPGTLVTGYGVLRIAAGGSYTTIEYGTIESKRIAEMPLRLETIFSRLGAVIERTRPDEFAIETAFYDKSAQSAMKLGQARGVAIVAARLGKLSVAEYAPRVIKKAVTGNGNASKEQVEYMIRTMLALKESERKLGDAYDALAVALTHAMRRSSGPAKARSWKDFIEKNPERVKRSDIQK